MKLSDAAVRNAKANGKVQKLSDGGGLDLHVTAAAAGSKLWRMAYRFEGKRKLLSFGAYPAVSLKDARRQRDDARELLARGFDPGTEKKQAREAVLAKEREERRNVVCDSGHRRKGNTSFRLPVRGTSLRYRAGNFFLHPRSHGTRSRLTLCTKK